MPTLGLAELVDLETRLAQDEECDPAELRARDRRIGLEIGAHDGDRKALLLAWLTRVREAEPTPGRRAVQAVSVVSLVLLVAGLVLGSGTTAGLLAYDGTRPVNVVNFLVVLVGLQSILLVGWCLVALPELPLLERVQSSLPGLSPGRLASVIGRLLPAKHREALAVVVGRWEAFDRLYDRVRHWQILSLSQVFAVAFNLGALLTCIGLVVFSDLAFCWSTTLEAQGDGPQEIVAALSAPWQAIYPDAALTDEIVSATRYVRLTESYVDPVLGPDLSGAWWPFLVACLLVYGLAPRLVTAWFSVWRFNRALARVELDHVGYQRVVERLRAPLLETRSPEKEVAADERGDGAAVLAPLDLGDRTLAVVDWGSVGIDGAALGERVSDRFGVAVDETLTAGGVDPESDAHALAALGTSGGAGRAVVIVVKVWEAPTRDFRRFVGSIRERLGDGAPVVVAPLELDGAGAPVPPEPDDLAQWARKLDALGDPWLRVEPLVAAP